MIHFKVKPTDTRYLVLTHDNEEDLININQLIEHINLTPPKCYMPNYKGPIYTEDFLFTYYKRDGSFIHYSSIGMWQEFYKFFKEKNIPFDGIENVADAVKKEVPHTFDEFKSIVDSWGLKYNPRPYQYECAYKILKYRNSLSQIATRAGKTLIAYIIFRYAMEYLNVHNILVIVPAVDLVKQAYNDFKDYKEFFNTECIWSGGELVESANVTVGTFQSLIKFLEPGETKYNPKFFDKFDLVFVDETHRATADQTKTIISQDFMLNVKYAFGLTGTLPEEKIDEYCLHALLGATIQKITPKQLQDGGYISDIEIHQEILTYKDTDKLDDLYIKCAEYAISDFILDDNGKKIELENPEFLIRYQKKMPYLVEQAKHNLETHRTQLDDFGIPDFLQFEEERKPAPGADHIKAQYINILKERVFASPGTNALFIEKMITHFLDERTKYIVELMQYCPGNTLILTHHVEYANHLLNKLKDYWKSRPILIVTGKINGKKRDEVKQVMKENDNVILVASYACMSTGLTLPKLKYGVLAESFKSNTLNMQSLGRGLGLVEGKDKYIVYDIIDKLPTNMLYSQANKKRKIYDNEDNQYKYKVHKVTL